MGGQGKPIPTRASRQSWPRLGHPKEEKHVDTDTGQAPWHSGRFAASKNQPSFSSASCHFNGNHRKQYKYVGFRGFELNSCMSVAGCVEKLPRTLHWLSASRDKHSLPFRKLLSTSWWISSRTQTSVLYTPRESPFAQRTFSWRGAFDSARTQHTT